LLIFCPSGPIFSIVQPVSNPGYRGCPAAMPCMRPWYQDLLTDWVLCVLCDLRSPVLLIYLQSLWHRRPYPKT
jgi:hypothetical protein